MDCSNLDYGSIDIVYDKNDYYIVDVNTTPYGGEFEIQNEVTSFLIDGISRLKPG